MTPLSLTRIRYGSDRQTDLLSLLFVFDIHVYRGNSLSLSVVCVPVKSVFSPYFVPEGRVQIQILFSKMILFTLQLSALRVCQLFYLNDQVV